MVHTELLAQAVPKSSLPRDDTESETCFRGKDDGYFFYFLYLPPKIPGFDNHWRQITVLDGPLA